MTFIYFKYKNKKRQSGTTLIELLIAVSIFIIFIGLTANYFTSALEAQRFSTSMRDASDSARFALERISKAARVSVIYSPTGTSTSLLIFHPRRGIKITYELRDGKIIEIEEGGLELPLTTDDVDVEKLQFIVKGVEAMDVSPSDDIQPQVTIIAHIRPTSIEADKAPLLRLQTTLSQRCLEVRLGCFPSS